MREVRINKGLIEVKETNFYSIANCEKHKFRMSYENKANNELFTRQKAAATAATGLFQLSGSGELVSQVTTNTGSKLLFCDDCFEQVENIK